MSQHPRVQYIYEVPSTWGSGGWHITATYTDQRKLQQMVTDAKRRGLKEGRDFRARVERRF